MKKFITFKNEAYGEIRTIMGEHRELPERIVLSGQRRKAILINESGPQRIGTALATQETQRALSQFSVRSRKLPRECSLSSLLSPLSSLL